MYVHTPRVQFPATTPMQRRTYNVRTVRSKRTPIAVQRAPARGLLRRLASCARDEAEVIAERIREHRDRDRATDAMRRFDRSCAERDEQAVRRVEIVDAPVCDRAARTGRALRQIGIEAELEAADVVADVIRLVEVWRAPHPPRGN